MLELHAHSYFSLLDGASSPEGLAAQAAALGMPVLALTDHDNVYGAVRFAEAARSVGVRAIHGAEMTTTDGHLTLLVQNAQGWANLCWLISQAQADAPKGEALLPIEKLEGRTAGLIALSGCRNGALSSAVLCGDDPLPIARRYRELFGGRYWVELQRHFIPHEDTLIRQLVEVARRAEAGIVATNNVHYAHRHQQRLQDVMVTIRHNLTLDAAVHLRRPNSEYYLKSAERICPLFADLPEAITNTQRIAEMCAFDLLGQPLQTLPIFPTPGGVSAAAYLFHLCEAALGEASTEVRQRLEHELTVIRRAGLANYFLVVWDIVRFACEHGIRCQGRGSAANSLVAYLLGISPIDPLKHDLVFERFLSDERRVVPDIDIDFDNSRREEVIQYVYRTYPHAAMACTFSTYRLRSALRDVGKTLGIPLPLLDEVNKAGTTPDTALWQHVLDLATQLKGAPRHLGIHNGGMIINGPPLDESIPIEPATMVDRTVVQWDKDALEAAGVVKIDILGLGMLAALSETVDLIEADTGKRIDLEGLTFDDPAVFDMIACADTVGLFQVESRAQQQVQPRLQPTTFEDLIVSISLIRPGPLQGNMVHPYLRRRAGEEPVSYPHPQLKPALEETLGVILYQEQVLKVARDLAGFTAGQGEVLRRALGSKHADAMMAQLHDNFVSGAVSKGVERPTAERVFEMLKAFGSYSFPKSHAAAFAVLVYQSGWLKRYYPAAFFAALLNNQPMGFWPPFALIGDARRHGVRFTGVDINRSPAHCTVQGNTVRLGLNQVDGIGNETAEGIVLCRESRLFRSLRDMCQRTRLPKRLVERLIRVGAFDAWGQRRKLLWELGTIDYQERLDLPPEPTPELPPTTRHEALADSMALIGLSTDDHPLALMRPSLQAQDILSSRDLNRCPPGEVVRVAGMVVVRQAPPTAKGVRFITLEDEFGFVNVIVRPQVHDGKMWRKGLLLVEGKVERRGTVVNLVAYALQSFT